VKMRLSVNHHASRDAALQRRRVGAHDHVQVHARAGPRAREDGLLDTEGEHGLRAVVSLGGAVGALCAVQLAAALVGAVHSEALGVSGAVSRALAVCAVDERDVEPELVVGDAVLELRVLAVEQLVGLADFDRRRRVGDHGLGVLGARGHVDRRRGAGGLADGPHPDVVAAAVADNGFTGGGKASGHGREKEGGGLGEEHVCDCVVFRVFTKSVT
jgi:hypothetical protein